MTIKHYILDDEHHPVECDLMTWARWFNNHEQRIVGSTETALYRVSTVFLGLDHNWSDRGPPVLFETMVFEKERSITKWSDDRLVSINKSVDEDDFFRRYSTWDEAEAGHNTLVRRIQKAEDDAKKMMKRKRHGHRSDKP
jgi:hypothetical protein